MTKKTKKNLPKMAVLAVEDWLAELVKQADEWDHRQIGSLLDQVKNAGGSVPNRYYSPEEAASTERVRLGRALSLAFSMELVDEEFKKDLRWKRRVKQLGSIETKATSILREISDDPVVRLMTTVAAPERRTSNNGSSWSASNILGALQLVIRRAASARRLLEEFGKAGGFAMNMDGPAKQPTLLQSLGSVYEEYLDADPLSGLTRTYNKPGGPFVAFIRAAYHLAKEETNDAALYKALQRAGFIGETDKA